MGTTLVFLEHHDGDLLKGSLGVLAWPTGWVATSPVSSSVPTRMWRRRPERSGPRPSTRATTLPSHLRCRNRGSTPSRHSSRDGAENVLFGSSVLAADVASRLAARLDAGSTRDLTGLTEGR